MGDATLRNIQSRRTPFSILSGIPALTAILVALPGLGSPSEPAPPDPGESCYLSLKESLESGAPKHELDAQWFDTSRGESIYYERFAAREKRPGVRGEPVTLVYVNDESPGPGAVEDGALSERDQALMKRKGVDILWVDLRGLGKFGNHSEDPKRVTEEEESERARSIDFRRRAGDLGELLTKLGLHKVVLVDPVDATRVSPVLGVTDTRNLLSVSRIAGGLARLRALSDKRNLRNEKSGPLKVTEQLGDEDQKVLRLEDAPGSWYTVQNGELKGRKIHYALLEPTQGQPARRAITLVGGLGYDLRRWNRTGAVDELRARGYQVLLIDPPGQGWTLLRQAFEDGSTQDKFLLPDRYPREVQAAVIRELMSHLRARREEPRLHEDNYLAGESYGGWLAAYLSTLPEFDGLIKGIIPLDPGMADTTHILPGADNWRKLREAAIEPWGGTFWGMVLETTLPKDLPGQGSYKAIMDGLTLTDSGQPPVLTEASDPSTIARMIDTNLEALMDTYLPEHFRKEDPLRYKAAVRLFLGIREWDATKHASEVRFPVHMIEAGENGGIVPHMQHADFMLNLEPGRARTWVRLLDTKHDIPAVQGRNLAGLIDAILDGKFEHRDEFPEGSRVDYDLATGKYKVIPAEAL